LPRAWRAPGIARSAQTLIFLMNRLEASVVNFSQQITRMILRAIIDDDDFKIPMGLPEDAPNHAAHHMGTVKGRNDNADQRLFVHHQNTRYYSNYRKINNEQKSFSANNNGF